MISAREVVIDDINEREREVVIDDINEIRSVNIGNVLLRRLGSLSFRNR